MGVVEWPTVSRLEQGWAMGEQELNKIVSIKKTQKKLKKKNLLNGPNDMFCVVWAIFVLLGTGGVRDVWRAGHG